MVADPLSTSVFAGINTAFKLGEFGLSLRDAPEEITVFCELIRRVRLDRAEAMRESREKAEQLKAVPMKSQWIEGTIRDVDSALVTIGALVESGRSDGVEGRSMTLKHRFEWVLSKKEGFLTKQSLLSTCHHSLCTAIVYMQSLPSPGPAWANPSVTSLPSYYSSVEERNEVLRAPSARRPTSKPVEPVYQIQASPQLSVVSLFSDDWQRTFASTPAPDPDPDSASYDTNASETMETMSSTETTLSVGTSEELPPPQPAIPPKPRNERQRRNEARFSR